jgi:glycosyltransferase involved in cell wall biosynthesis
MKISVAIISRDKNNILPQCLATAGQVSDDVVVVTKEDHPFVNFSDQKNYAASLCKNDWVLSLDDDEWLSPELIREINNLSVEYAAYKISRMNYIFGKPIYHTNWGPDEDTHIWLYDKNSCEWVGSVHEEVKTDGSVGKLEGYKIHQNYVSVDQFMTKLNDYTTLEEKAVNPLWDFARRYIWHKGFLDGWHGLFLSYLMMIYHLVVWVKKKSSLF